MSSSGDEVPHEYLQFTDNLRKLESLIHPKKKYPISTAVSAFPNPLAKTLANGFELVDIVSDLHRTLPVRMDYLGEDDS